MWIWRWPARNVGFVRHHDDGAALAVQAVEDLDDLLARLGIQVSGRLVGQDDFRIVDQGAGNGDPLLLTAGELKGPVVEAIGQADIGGDLNAAVAVRCVDGRIAAAVVQRDFDILQHRVLGDQVVRLENETDHLVAGLRQVIVGHRGDIAAAQDVIAVGRPVERAQQIEQRAFPTSRRTHDRHEIPLGEIHGDAAEGLHDNGAQIVVLVQIDNLAGELHHLIIADAPGRQKAKAPGERGLN